MEEKGITTNVHHEPLPIYKSYKNLGLDIKIILMLSRCMKMESLLIHTLLTYEQAVSEVNPFKEIIGELDYGGETDV